MKKYFDAHVKKFVAVGILGCGVCCAPFVLPLVVAISGGGMIGVGFGAIGGVVIFIALVFGYWRWKKPRQCAHETPCGS